jgi:hypothetical protein
LSSPYQYPWVSFNLAPTANIDSTPLLVFGSESNSIVDSIFVCNTTDQEIFVDITTLSERNLQPITTYIVRNFLLPGYGSAELIKESVINLEAGDIIYANSDFSGNLFDCMISYRQLLETKIS